MPRTLTTHSVERMKPNPSRRIEVPDAALPGFYLVIQSSGRKSWAVRYRFGGRPRKLTLGPYPAVDLATARARARDAVQAVSVGRDPGAEKVEARRNAREKPDTGSVSAWAAEFLERHVRRNNRPATVEGAERTFRDHVIPAWGARNVREVTRQDVVALLDGFLDRGMPSAANRALAVIRKFFGWLVERGEIPASPCDRLKAPAAETSRDRVFTDDELRLAWRAAESIGYPFGPLVQILVLTAQRRDEVAKMRWTEISGDQMLWTIPAERAKNGVAHHVPLSEAARGVLAAVPRIAGKPGFVFTPTGERAVSGYSSAKARLDAEMLGLARAEAEARGEASDEVNIAPWRLHDLRRTAATGMARLGQPVHVIEAVLNHTSGAISGVAAVYNRHRYLDEKRAALEAWAYLVLTLRAQQ
jgi:integrase